MRKKDGEGHVKTAANTLARAPMAVPMRRVIKFPVQRRFLARRKRKRGNKRCLPITAGESYSRTALSGPCSFTWLAPISETGRTSYPLSCLFYYFQVVESSPELAHPEDRRRADRSGEEPRLRARKGG